MANQRTAFARPRYTLVIAICQTFLTAAGAWSLDAGASLNAAEGPRGVAGQTREFVVSVDGKARGTCTMQIRRRDDGAEIVHSQLEVRMNMVVYKYAYASSGTEVWKHGRLLALESAANYNGTEYMLKAGATQRGLQVAINGVVSMMDPDTWITSYWQIPPKLADGARRGGTKIALLDSDKGRKLNALIERVGEETIMVGGHPRSCTRYHLSGDVHVDLWYDSSRRLVCQESQEFGHKVRIELTRVAAE